MNETDDYVRGNNTVTFPNSSPNVWPVVFLLLLIPAGVAVYKYRSKLQRIFQPAHRRNPKKEDRDEASAADSHQYSHLRAQSSSKQAPIYENLTRQKAEGNAARVNQRR